MTFKEGADGSPQKTSNGSDITTPQPQDPSKPLAENSLLVDISDALSEKDRVKFTVHTRTTLQGYAKPDFFVVRQHEEFVWLHDRFEENEEYAGYIVSYLELIKSKFYQSFFVKDPSMSTKTRF